MTDSTHDEELLRTPLAPAHEAMGARMVEFSGWLMPVQYTSIVAEHAHTREAASLFDLSHMGRVRITGDSAEDLLQRAFTNDAARLKVGGAQYTLACNENGGIIEDLIVYRFDDFWQLIVNASNRVRMLGHLQQLAERLDLDVSIEDETFATALIGVQGPLSQEVVQPLVDFDLDQLSYYRAAPANLVMDWAEGPSPQPSPAAAGEGDSPAGQGRVRATVSRTGYTGEDGFELTIPAADAETVWQTLLADSRVAAAGLGARDTLRLEAGMALYGHELTEDINPYEAGLSRVVKLEKADFEGKRVLEKLSQAAPGRTLIGLLLQRGAVPRAGFTVHRDGEQVGVVASGTFSPTLNRPIATAYVHGPAPLPDTDLAVSIRNALVPARVVSLPFVPHHTRGGSGQIAKAPRSSQ